MPRRDRGNRLCGNEQVGATLNCFSIEHGCALETTGRMGHVRLVRFEWSSMSVMPASSSDFDDVVRIKAWIVPGAFARRPGAVTLGIADDGRAADREVAAFVRMAVNPQVDVL